MFGLGQCNANLLIWMKNSINLLIVGIDSNPDSINRSLVHINRELQLNSSNQFEIIPVALSNVTEPTYMNFLTHKMIQELQACMNHLSFY